MIDHVEQDLLNVFSVCRSVPCSNRLAYHAVPEDGHVIVRRSRPFEQLHGFCATEIPPGMF